jgi:DNA-binding XRE family transcriptional regulator
MKRKLSFPKTTNIRKASSISKIKSKLTSHPNINDYTGAKMKSHLKEILNSFNDYTLKSKSTAAKLIKAENNNIAKESVILSLREDLDYHKHVNKNYNIYKKYATDICDYYKQNFEEIFQYKSNLSNDLKDFIKLIDNYEEEIEKCKNDRQTTIKTSEDIIKYKKSEKEKMGERLRKLNYDLEKQDKKLNNITNLLKEYQEQNENYLDRLSNCELSHMEKYEILEDKYNKLVAKYKFYTDREMKKRKIELEYKDKNLCKEEEDLADLKLQDNLIKNVFLREIADEIKKQINEIELVNQKYLEEQELLKFLGKVFYNKVKQRRAEAEMAQEEMSKTMCGSRSRKKLNSKGNNTFTTNINTINIQINTGNTRDNIINTTKDSKSKMNFTTTGTI